MSSAHPAQVEHDADDAARYLSRLIQRGVPNTDAVAMTNSYMVTRQHLASSRRDAPLVVPPGLAS